MSIQNPPPITDGLRKFHMEGICATNSVMTTFGYFRVTYRRDRDKMNVAELSKKFKIVAEAKIPITPTESIDMSLKVQKNGTENYTMQYRDNHSGLRIRCDTAHGKPHVDEEWPLEKQKKTWLPNQPKNYEQAINLILTRAEQNNPRIGAFYSLMPPIVSNADTVERLLQLKFKLGIETPLTVLARATSVKLMNVAISKKGNSPMTNEEIFNIFEEKCKEIAQQERNEGKPLQVLKVSYRKDVMPFPFTITMPPESFYTFEDYPFTGNNMRDNLVGITFKV